MNKTEMLDWLIDNKISIQYHSPIKWTREDGSFYWSDFVMSSPSTQFAGYSDIIEAISDVSAWYNPALSNKFLLEMDDPTNEKEI